MNGSCTRSKSLLSENQYIALYYTGKIDKAVVKKIKEARCGMADSPPSGSDLATYTEHSRWESNFDERSGFYQLSYA